MSWSDSLECEPWAVLLPGKTICILHFQSDSIQISTQMNGGGGERATFLLNRFEQKRKKKRKPTHTGNVLEHTYTHTSLSGYFKSFYRTNGLSVISSLINPSHNPRLVVSTGEQEGARFSLSASRRSTPLGLNASGPPCWQHLEAYFHLQYAAIRDIPYVKTHTMHGQQTEAVRGRPRFGEFGGRDREEGAKKMSPRHERAKRKTACACTSCAICERGGG